MKQKTTVDKVSRVEPVGRLKSTEPTARGRAEDANVDSWVLANDVVGGHLKPDNEEILRIDPIRFHRRQLHMFQPAKGNVRKPYGSTRSLGFSRGSLVKHPKFGVVYVGGHSKGGLSLHSLVTGIRIARSVKPKDIKLISNNVWRGQFLPRLKPGVPLAEN